MRNQKLIIGSLLALASVAAYGAPFDSQWALQNNGQKACGFDGEGCQDGTKGADIKATEAWKRSNDCSSVLVAVLDTGANQKHPNLAGNLVPGHNFVSDIDSTDPEDDNLHGTHVSGIIAGNGTTANGVMGVCHKARVLPIKVADAMGRLTDADVIEGINFAASQKAQIVNASFGGSRSNDFIKKAIAKANKTLFVVAAGNGDWFGNGYDVDTTPVYPLSYKLPNIVGVAATDNRDQLGSFSNFGVGNVDLAAPGVNIFSTLPLAPTAEMKEYNVPAQMGTMSGTSMAAPYVAGAAALLLSVQPKLTVAKLKEKLMLSVDKMEPLKTKVASGGRLNLATLLK